VISVSDTGSGMSKSTLARAFEPFFTTKETGRGTGLGLSMVYDFVKQSGGHVTIYSEEGEGTTVKLYFPRHLSSEATPGEEGNEPEYPSASDDEVVLVVEDNPEVRAFSVMSLSELGYRVLQAADAEAALTILRSDHRVDLLFTDVVMPGRTGRVLADESEIARPGLKVLFMTGYSRNAIVASRVREVLDESAK
jgi:CheY-like chemotaxis protein